jgi:hypothetical protein
MYATAIKSAFVALALAGAVNAAAIQPYPDKCGDMVCPPDKARCCSVPFNGGVGLECLAECPPQQPLTTMATVVTSAPPAMPTFGPKCGDSFFCKPGQVCCTLYTCADTPEQCPK